MRVLLDECVPRKLRRELSGHEVLTVTEQGWSGIKNGKLLSRVCALASEFNPNKPNVSIPCARSDAHGRFELDLSKAGSYTLYCTYFSRGYVSTYMPFFRQPSASRPRVRLDDANPGASVAIKMPPKNGLLVGKVVDAATGLPVESVEFLLCDAARAGVCLRTGSKSRYGSFRTSAPYVPFNVRVKAEGYEDWLGPEGGNGSPMTVEPETQAEFTVFLKRSEAFARRAPGEAEKQTGVNLPAPAQTAPADGAAFDHFPRVTKLEWSPVEGAVAYAVEIDYCSGGDRSACVNPQALGRPGDPATDGLVGTDTSSTSSARRAAAGASGPWTRKAAKASRALGGVSSTFDDGDSVGAEARALIVHSGPASLTRTPFGKSAPNFRRGRG